VDVRIIVIETYASCDVLDVLIYQVSTTTFYVICYCHWVTLAYDQNRIVHMAKVVRVHTPLKRAQQLAAFVLRTSR